MSNKKSEMIDDLLQGARTVFVIAEEGLQDSQIIDHGTETNTRNRRFVSLDFLNLIHFSVDTTIKWIKDVLTITLETGGTNQLSWSIST